jgi:hypothetical protein
MLSVKKGKRNKMASIPQSIHMRNTYQHAASLLRSGKSMKAIKQVLVDDGLSEDRAQAVVDNLRRVKRSSFYHFVRLHPLLSRVDARLRQVIKR